jgi:hypothetical protein
MNKSLIFIICLMLFVGCGSKNVPYTPNTANVTNPKATIKRVLMSQPSDKLPLRVEVTDEYIQTFHLEESINKTAIAIGLLSNSSVVSTTTTRPVITTVYYSYIGEVEIVNKNDCYCIEIYDGGGRILLSAHTYTKNEAIAFGDAVAALRDANSISPAKSAYTYPDSVKYKDDWKDAEQHGFGSYAYPDGSKYDGEWKNGLMHGQGTFKYPNGTKYEGQWKYGKAHGMGIMTWPDNALYVGQWKDNKRNGQGAMTYPDGTKQVGEFRDGKFVEE